MNKNERLAVALQHCKSIADELTFSQSWLSKESIDAKWVADLGNDDFRKERVSAFCARFVRFQDYLADKIIKLWLEAVGERVGVAFENFSAVERAGILSIPSEQMLEMRLLRNRLTHEYFDAHETFAHELNSAIIATTQLIETFNNLQEYCKHRLHIDETK
ncbi:MAG TPA: hypothetical protein VFW53_11560 [Gallionella sp.]|nr:hypothetical protein [Gallionella sp.]